MSQTNEALPLPSTDPSPAAPRGVTADTRIPLSVPRQKHSTPKIPGYYTRWFMDTEARVAQCLAAGYEFVTKEEVAVNNFSVAGDRGDVGGSDLGSRVTIVAGGEGANGQAARQVLMKLKNEFREQDLRAKEARSEKLVEALRAGKLTPEREGPEHRYVNHGNIFTKRRPLG